MAPELVRTGNLPVRSVEKVLKRVYTVYMLLQANPDAVGLLEISW